MKMLPEIEPVKLHRTTVSDVIGFFSTVDGTLIVKLSVADAPGASVSQKAGGLRQAGKAGVHVRERADSQVNIAGANPYMRE